MAAYFFDSSALAKRYMQEDGTPLVRAITQTRTQPFNEVYVARIAVVEVCAALVRRQQQRNISQQQLKQVLDQLHRHFRQRYQVLEITSDVVSEAVTQVKTHKLRAYDAVQLAVALKINDLRQKAGLEPVTFVCADSELNQAAQKTLSVINPQHP